MLDEDNVGELLERVLCLGAVQHAQAVLVKRLAAVGVDHVVHDGVGVGGHAGAVDALVRAGDALGHLHELLPRPVAGGVGLARRVEDRLVVVHGDGVVIARHAVQHAVDGVCGDGVLRIAGEVDRAALKQIADVQQEAALRIVDVAGHVQGDDVRRGARGQADVQLLEVGRLGHVGHRELDVLLRGVERIDHRVDALLLLAHPAEHLQLRGGARRRGGKQQHRGQNQTEYLFHGKTSLSICYPACRRIKA